MLSELEMQLARLGDAPAMAAISRELIEAGLPWNWTPRRIAALMRQRDCLAVTAKVRAPPRPGPQPEAQASMDLAASSSFGQSVRVRPGTAGELAGFVLATFGEEHVHLALLGVAEEWRRRGIARRLVRWVEESAQVAGLFEVRLEVRAINRGARRFYAALGYVECGRVRAYYSGIEDAIRLRCDLRAARFGAGSAS